MENSIDVAEILKENELKDKIGENLEKTLKKILTYKNQYGFLIGILLKIYENIAQINSVEISFLII